MRILVTLHDVTLYATPPNKQEQNLLSAHAQLSFWSRENAKLSELFTLRLATTFRFPVNCNVFHC